MQGIGRVWAGRGMLAIGLAGAILTVGTGAAAAGTTTGNGAQKSALSPASNGGNVNSCTQGSRGSNGFAILNKTGAPVPGTSIVQGEVHIVDAALKGQTVMAFVVPSSSSNCMSMVMTTITLNNQGIGNGHLKGPEMNGSYYVTIMQGNNEVLASKAVNLL
jgi:hypothetical protein